MLLNDTAPILKHSYNKLLISWLEAAQINLSVSVAKWKHLLLTRHTAIVPSQETFQHLSFWAKVREKLKNRPIQGGKK